MKVYFETFGCQMNLSDTEVIYSMLEGLGYEETENPADADCILVNTCTVRHRADEHALIRINELKTFKKKGALLGIVGCLAQRMGNELTEKYPHVDFVLGPGSYHRISEYLAGNAKEKTILDFEKGETFTERNKWRGKNFNAWISISKGCNNYCSYCIVPHVRGREICRDFNDIISACREAVAKGYPEVTLLGQNVNSYSYKNDSMNFALLLREVDKVEGLRRVRFMTSHPKDLNDDIIDAMAECKTVCEFLHLPLQAGSNRILELMNRKYSVEDYCRLVEKVRNKIPDIALSTDILVGFPSETEDEFRQTLEIVREVRFDAAFTFVYSPRPGTCASFYEDSISSKVKIGWVNELIKLQMEITKGKNREHIGRLEEVMIEGVSKKDPEKLTARTRGYKNVILKGKEGLIGSFLNVKIVDARGWALFGEPIGD